MAWSGRPFCNILCSGGSSTRRSKGFLSGRFLWCGWSLRGGSTIWWWRSCGRLLSRSWSLGGPSIGQSPEQRGQHPEIRDVRSVFQQIFGGRSMANIASSSGLRGEHEPAYRRGGSRLADLPEASLIRFRLRSTRCRRRLAGLP